MALTAGSEASDARRRPDDHGPEPRHAPEAGIDFENANAARMYDWFLGGAHNFAVDRERAAAIMAANPHAAELARANRAFLGRAAEWCLDAGIRQFLDLGSGVPTAGNVHEIAHALDPHARVAYVDFEPVAAAHATELLDGIDAVSITRADLREPDAVLAAPGVAGLLDLDRPIAVLAVSVLHFVDFRDEQFSSLLARYTRDLVPGSAVVVSHLSDDHDDPELAERVRGEAAALQDSATPCTLRSRAQLSAALEQLPGFELVAPGLIDILDWPAPQLRHRDGAGLYGAVARRPA